VRFLVALLPLTWAVAFNSDSYEVKFSGQRQTETSLLIPKYTPALNTTLKGTFMSCRTSIQREVMMLTPDITSVITIDSGFHHTPSSDITLKYRNRER
jgi:hypothetical protein